MLMYYSWQGEGSPDIPRIRESCRQTVATHDILRTAFVSYKNRLLQVVLRDLDLEIPVYQTYQDLSVFTEQMQKCDMYRPPRLGTPLVQFAIVHQIQEDKFRIITRLSHAQYDGMSISKIWDAMQEAYNGQSTKTNTASSHANYMSALELANGDASRDYWRRLLEGSAITSFVSRNRPSLGQAGTSVGLTKMVSLPQSDSTFTFATVIKAAWAYVLAQKSATHDVVFGSLISGRNLADTDAVVGACVNCIPVRVQMGQDWCAKDLLSAVQDQAIKGIPHETLGFREVVQACNNWPSWTFFNSIITHQNLEGDEGDDALHTDGGPLKFMEAVGGDADIADVSIVSSPAADNCMEISLYCLEEVISRALADDLHNLLCDTVSAFMKTPEMSLLTTPQLEELTPTIPRRDTDFLDPDSEKSVWSLEMSTPERLWGTVLNCDISFFGMGGDLVSACLLANEMRAEGIRCSIEDVFENPTLSYALQLSKVSNKL